MVRILYQGERNLNSMTETVREIGVEDTHYTAEFGGPEIGR